VKQSIIRLIENKMRLSKAFAFVISFLCALVTFIAFFRNIDTLNTSKEWKFYFSLIGFLIFFSMFIIVATVTVARAVGERKNGK